MVLLLIILIILVFAFMLHTQTQRTPKNRKATMPKWLKPVVSKKKQRYCFFGEEETSKNAYSSSFGKLAEFGIEVLIRIIKE